MPTEGGSLRQEDNEWSKNESDANHSAMDELGWKYKMECKNPDDSPQKGEEWRRKENVNEEATAKMKNIDKWRTTTKWRSRMKNNNIPKPSLEVLPSKVTLLGVFDFLKKWLQKCF